MKAGGAHAKGADFERVLAKQLSHWVTAGARNDIFWRTPGSGSRATNITALAHGGDICATHELGRPFCQHVLIECKFYRKIDWRHLLMENRGDFFKFWLKLTTECRKTNQSPLLVLKENGRTVLLVTDAASDYYLFGDSKAIVIAKSGMFVHQLDTLLAQSYETVCGRLQKAHTCSSIPPPSPSPATVSSTSHGLSRKLIIPRTK